MSRILIRNLRRIRQLDFSIPTEFGTVFLLTGTNGSGKSTLFSCLSQIADPKILDQMFCPNVQFYESSASNTYTKSLITYETDAGTVSFHYGEDRWISSLSRENTLKILSSAGFSTVVYSGAHPKKIMTAQNLSVQDIQNADDDLRNALTVIFDDKNFRNLYYVTDHETQNVIYLLKENIDGQNYYFSENNFSRGERAIICLINKMANLPKHSLVLIDESEMSLHPKAQKRLLIYLQIFAAERQLQIILSTQSASIIKIFKPEKILFLEKENDQDGVLVCRRNVYPAAILGEMAFADEILPEMVLLVEDAEAAMLLEEIVSRLKQIVPLNFPYCKILPVGGYMQVVIMMDNFGKIFPSYVRQRAVLDKDAESILNKAFKNP